jgi:hypothetical protein
MTNLYKKDFQSFLLRQIAGDLVDITVKRQKET